ncbi:hypothetical protein TNIN_15861 [Trichonephila inaurata madagascariensis]|uniref:Uncharacterized protein n=1 Tax=Trichonephila inaurata madagascariensis TaxID=2747483 RepID=A0A8X6XES9_9ARAC|nr:hypothetical protein TNIN_15861 [Trichonephila inaurata madagascariensis]
MDQVVKLIHCYKRRLPPKAIHPCCVGGFQSCIRRSATQAEETGSIRKVIALGTELPLTAQHPMQVSNCHLSLETDASRLASGNSS